LSETELIKKIDSIQKDLAEIKRNISSPLLYDKTEKKDSLVDHSMDLSKRIENVEKKLKSLSGKKGTTLTRKDDKKQEKKLDLKEINTFDDFNTSYDYAINLFKLRKYDEAIITFENLLHARLQKPELIDNIFYWIGECHYAKGKYEPAIENFQKVLSVPRANKIEDALMMMGLSYEKLNKIEEARESYQRLIDTQPKSRFIPKAKEKLKRLI
jgi:TolA-binding protein